MSLDIITFAKNNNMSAIKKIIYSGWIFPRMVLLRFYTKSNFDIRKNISDYIGIYGVNFNVIDNYNLTALHYMVNFNNYICMNMMLRFGANVNIVDNKGNTALHLACQEGKEKCVETLIKFHANPYIINNTGSNSLFTASWYGQTKCKELLLNHICPDGYDNKRLYWED